MTDSNPSVADQILSILERQRATGQDRISLSPENHQFLADLAEGKIQSPQPAAKSTPPAPTPAAAPPSRPEPAAAPTPAPEPPRQDPIAPPKPEPVVEARPEPSPAPAAPAPPPPKPAAAPPQPQGDLAPGLNAGESLPDLGQFDLDSLAAYLAPCRRCVLCQKRKQTVFGVGKPDADLMFIGEGPGADEDAQGEPFVGRAGELLTKIIEAMTFSRDDVYIANIVKCRPPGNRNPEPDEAAACMPFLRRQIELVQPRVIVILGNIPLRFLLPHVQTGITRTRGTWLEYEGIPVMPTFHPSYLLRNPRGKRDVWNDMQDVMKRLGRAPGEAAR